jgi:hypothetical protein
MQFKNSEEVENWLNTNTKAESCGIFIETDLGEGNEIFYICKHIGLNKKKPKDALYVFDTVTVSEDNYRIDTFQCGCISELFENGAEYINIISESNVVLKLKGESASKEFKKHEFLVKTTKENIAYDYFNNNELIELLNRSGNCPTESHKCNSTMDCSQCWRDYVVIRIS